MSRHPEYNENSNPEGKQYCRRLSSFIEYIRARLQKMKKEEEFKTAIKVQIEIIRMFLRDVSPEHQSKFQRLYDDPELRRMMNRLHLGLLWHVLPKGVTVIDFGDDMVERPDFVHEGTVQVVWNFEDIQAYGKYLSQHIGQKWARLS